MNLPSFAHFNHAGLLTASLSALLLAACATLPPPTQELAEARQAVALAGDADADQYAPDLVESARAELSRAEAAMAAGDENEARAGALAAAAAGDLAAAHSRAQVLEQELAQRRNEIDALRGQLGLAADGEGDGLVVVPAPMAGSDAMTPAMRLQALDSDPRYAGRAAYERLRARQAVATLEQARRSERADAAVVAARRVAVAEEAARNELLGRAVDQADRNRSELLVEASRREAERARQEAERLRVQAQIQAEEAERLRAMAEAEAAARQQAEEVILDVGGEQARKLREAREREAELKRQEAELLEAQQAAGEDDGS